jgi:DME family drug/metabolite transporter
VRDLLGLLLVAVAAITWGTTGTTLKLIGSDSATTPLVVGAIRMLVAAPLLVATALLAGQPFRLSKPTLGTGACMAAYQMCYFSAVPLAGVAATALLAICSAPVLIAVLARLLLAERFTAQRLTALALGVVGAALLVTGVGIQPSAGPGFVLGALLALGAGLSYSLYAVVTKRSLASGDPHGLAALTFSAAAVVLLPFLVTNAAEAATLASQAWPLLLYLGLLPTAVAYALYTRALRHVPATAAAVVGLLEPLTATLLGTLLFGETLSSVGLVGALLLLTAVVVLALR